MRVASQVVRSQVRSRMRARKNANRAKPGPREVQTTGRRLSYAPDLDGRADPGEVVWTWVPYEDDPSQGKDRPVLIVGRDGSQVFGLMLSSRDHDGDRGWLALGAGAWDREQRPSWVRTDRVLQMKEFDIRREGAVLARDRFDRIADALRRDHGWS